MTEPSASAARAASTATETSVAGSHKPATAPVKGSVSTMGAIAIGVGGMMGAGLYTLLGLAATTAGVWIPVAFLIGAIVALFSVYSYSKLGATFPGRGGAGTFLLRGFGDTTITGGLNVFQFFGWIIAMALYAVGFGGYAVKLFDGMPDWASKAFGVGLVLVVIVINFVGSKWVSRSEMFVVVVELIIIAIFLGFGFAKADYSTFFEGLTSGKDSHWTGVFFAAGLLYVTYEGFGVVTNSAGAMKNPKKQLPRAMYTALIVVTAIYIVVSSVVVVLLSVSKMEADQGHVLAAAAEVVMGRTGFILLSAAALLATASAVNATLFGDSNLAYMMGRRKEMPKIMDKPMWHGGYPGILVGAAITIGFVAFFPLSDVGQMASLAFLLIYASVSLGHLRVVKLTGAKPWLLWMAIILNLGLFGLLIGHSIAKKEYGTWITLIVVFIVSFAAEEIYRRVTGRHFNVDSLKALDPHSGDASTLAAASASIGAADPDADKNPEPTSHHPDSNGPDA